MLKLPLKVYFFSIILSILIFGGCATSPGEKRDEHADTSDVDSPGAGDTPGSSINEREDNGSTDELALNEKTENRVDNGEVSPSAERFSLEDKDGDGYPELPYDKSGNPIPLSLKDVVHLVLDNNNTVKLQQLEIIKSDTELKKQQSKYATNTYMSYQGYVKKDPTEFSSPFAGNVTTNDVYRAGVSRLFSSGTFLQLEVSDTRFDNNAGEGALAYLSAGSFLSMIKVPPVHTGALTLMLSQELLKNSFGYSQARIDEIARNNSFIQRESLVYQLSQLVVKAMVDYWSLAIMEENVETQKLLNKNIKNIRDITLRKTGLGLAESFEVNQWNALFAQSENAVNMAEQSRENKRRELLRTMNLDPDLRLSGATKLAEEIPGGLDTKRDIEAAYRTRPDFKNIQLQMENTRMAKEIAENNLLPSVTLSGKYSSRDQGLHANTAFNAVPDGTYPESSVEFKVQYPLWDEGAKVDHRNATIGLKQLEIQQKQMKRQVHDEIIEGYDQIKVAYEAMKNAKYALAQTESFYQRLITRYRQGRFTAEAVKNALDGLFQARLGYMQARVNFNIALVQYDMVRNNIWNRFDVNIDQVIDELAEKGFSD